MRVTPGPARAPSAMCASARRAAGGSAGFSLLEVVVAAALLLLTVTAVSTCVTTVSGAGQRLDAALAADRAMAEVAARLVSLPFCPAELPAPSAARGAGAMDLLSAAFPHAGAVAGPDGGRYVGSDEERIPAGSFVSTLECDGVAVECVARFRSPDGGWVGPDALDGFDLATADAAPAAVLVLHLRTATVAGSRTWRLEARAGAWAEVDAAEGGAP